MTRGFLLGKFLPPHRGHQLLCDTAAGLCDKLTILVCSLPGDPVPGADRHRWLAAMYPAARVLHLSEPVPQAPEDHPDFWPIWRTIINRLHPEPIDLVFTSDDYGRRLAAELGARWVPVDPDRATMPISGRALMADPMAHWPQLSEVARPWFARRVCLCGAESTGKSTLAAALAAHFDTIALPEYGRTYCEAFGTELTSADLHRIAAGHVATRDAALRHVNRILIEDTDIVMTCAWAEMLFGAGDTMLQAIPASANAYLLLDTDIPWIDDGTRLFGTPERRARFQALTGAELERRGIVPILVTGSEAERFATAIAAVESVLAR